LTLFNNNRERSVIITDDIFNHSSNNAAGKISAEIKIPRVTSKQKKKENQITKSILLKAMPDFHSLFLS